MHSLFSLPYFDWDKNVITFGVDTSSSLHSDNKGKDILILGKGPTRGLDDTKLSAEGQYSINFSRSNRKKFLSHYNNGSNSFLFVNATKICQFKVKDSEKNISLVFRKHFRFFSQ